MTLIRQFETVLMQDVKNAKKGRKNKKAHSTINGYVFPRKAIEEVVYKSTGDMPLAIVGEPGVGKSFFATNALKEIYEDMFGIPYRLIYTNPYQLKSPSDTFARPTLKAGNLEWEHTWPVQEVKKAAESGEAVLWIVEEYTRMSPQGQNFFLELCASGTMHIEQTGDVIKLPPFSKIVLIGNIKGIGVSSHHEALEDRVSKILWPLPDEHTVTEMLLNRFDKKKNEFSGHKQKTSSDIEIKQRKLNRDAAGAIVSAALEVNKIRREPVSLRGMERCLSLYTSLPSLNDAIKMMVEGELARGIDTDDVDVRKTIMEIQYDLKKTLAKEKAS